MTTAVVLPERERTQFRAIKLGSFVDMEFRADGAKREFEGIAVPWDVEIDVDGWAFEVWRSGAFNHQLRAANRIKVGDGHIPLGGKLVGALKEARNDGKGLYVRGGISKIPAGDDVMELMTDKALDELSIGFYRVPGGDSVTRKADGRPLYEMSKADLFEVALVPFGAYGRKAKVDNVRERDLGAGRERIEVARTRTVSILVDGAEVASYRLPLSAEPVVEVVDTTDVVVEVVENVPDGVADLDAMLAALPTF
jgi:HK97 family phage prohead protease